MESIFSILYNESERHSTVRIIRRRLRDALNPYDIPENVFCKIYRLTPSAARDFVLELEPFIENTFEPQISFDMKFLAALNFYASGTYRTTVGTGSFASMSRSMVSKIIKMISTVISKNLLQKYVCFPATNEAKKAIAARFEEKTGMPGVIGIVDGMHVAVGGLNKLEKIGYRNRKNFHSLNVQIICDCDHNLIGINARYPGSCCDSFVWDNSIVMAHLKKTYISQDNRTDHWLLGDSGYPLQPWLLTPIKNPGSVQEEHYNLVHKEIRASVERVIGCLKTTFRATLGEPKLRYRPAMVGNIINSCATLYNFKKLRCSTKGNYAECLSTSSTSRNSSKEKSFNRNRLVNMLS